MDWVPEAQSLNLAVGDSATSRPRGEGDCFKTAWVIAAAGLGGLVAGFFLRGSPWAGPLLAISAGVAACGLLLGLAGPRVTHCLRGHTASAAPGTAGAGRAAARAGVEAEVEVPVDWTGRAWRPSRVPLPLPAQALGPQWWLPGLAPAAAPGPSSKPWAHSPPLRCISLEAPPPSPKTPRTPRCAPTAGSSCATPAASAPPTPHPQRPPPSATLPTSPLPSPRPLGPAPAPPTGATPGPLPSASSGSPCGPHCTALRRSSLAPASPLPARPLPPALRTALLGSVAVAVAEQPPPPSPTAPSPAPTAPAASAEPAMPPAAAQAARRWRWRWRWRWRVGWAVDRGPSERDAEEQAGGGRGQGDAGPAAGPVPRRVLVLQPACLLAGLREAQRQAGAEAAPPPEPPSHRLEGEGRAGGGSAHVGAEAGPGAAGVAQTERA
ncbi:hypothetical protein HYH03_010497 [Edaphochlamys debaryana]|uniref:Uncharacterized protein n=1 Tax=Edaphochlamys debaryana TaxID=47281 RepID=A0A836BVU9_9CHLO|nr:hypothetical protein HYH03_010497 [Edaphochlamys debaryana]|eukprot:KAG2491051.1 hypothetical protein HYH03_010497 [Edaphochlamys debaryana]